MPDLPGGFLTDGDHPGEHHRRHTLRSVQHGVDGGDPDARVELLWRALGFLW
jgi:hypothetical protein